MNQLTADERRNTPRNQNLEMNAVLKVGMIRLFKVTPAFIGVYPFSRRLTAVCRFIQIYFFRRM
jgi:hypothetical protein